MTSPLRLYGERVEIHKKATVRPERAVLGLLDRIGQEWPYGQFTDSSGRRYEFLPIVSREGYHGSIMLRDLAGYARNRKDAERSVDRITVGKMPIMLAFPDKAADVNRGTLVIRVEDPPIYPTISVTFTTNRYEYSGTKPSEGASRFVLDEFEKTRAKVDEREIQSSDSFQAAQKKLLQELKFRLAFRWGNYYPEHRGSMNYPPETFEWSQGRLICWDLDDTLGNFRGIYDPNGNPKIRAGIGGVLEKLGSRDFTHVVTTISEKNHADRSLALSGLQKYFASSFYNKDISVRGQKYYKPVIDSCGFSEEDAAARMVVMGDYEMDQPIDLEALFILLDDREGPKMDSAVLWEVLDAVDGEVDGNFIEGHRKLFERGAPAGEEMGEPFRRVGLETGISFDVGYITILGIGSEEKKKKRSPIIKGITAPQSYLKEMEEVQAAGQEA